ncbi:MAG: hypothetical protein B7Y31_10545 [Novosphingobium sp. 16-62-11]|uniref:hypothetical protein n=1 Tax=Novosphingobium sp. 17-62-19 TaxID=1970406 RepID=UPI000BC6E919|nr:hypothetical protein [Novosphingobium sp. 17-62-19]OYZ36109.1 MAG: hypothetical protein B7Y31_10545 [Novosphingobium sp. 16-62-11]OZA19158.1 MAG: hypothetical protein B7X90_09725 [Novosphingobium sp. 17-62-19]HQS97277.1 hypothetical protein [Novosphingobium sp.]
MVRNSRFDLAVFGILALVMLVTRTHSLSNVMHLPDTSLASFFALGFLVRRGIAFAALFALAYAIDVTVIGWFGQSDFCFTPAYWMLVPAYGTMWLAGRFGAEKLGERASALPAITVLLVAATFVSQLFSSGGFYFLGGRFEDPTLAGFMPRLGRYFPSTLYATLLWTAAAAGVLALLSMARPQLRADSRK